MPDEYLVQRPYALAEARDGLRVLMATVPAPTAIVCGNDVLAFGALLEAARLGIAVPRELSIVGFDDLEMARHIRPALTTLHVPTEAMWVTAAERLIAALAQEPVPLATEVEVELLVRESTGPVLRGWQRADQTRPGPARASGTGAAAGPPRRAIKPIRTGASARTRGAPAPRPR